VARIGQNPHDHTAEGTGVAPTETKTDSSWLSQQEIDEVRGRVPIVYVEAVPVRIDHLSCVQRVGLLLRTRPDHTVSRAVVSGRVLWGETVREALWRHLNKDLGPDAEPQLPTQPAPFTVAEYFPEDRRHTGFSDPRQHAVALAYVVPVDGECVPPRDALDLAWLTPSEAVSPSVADEMTGGQDRLVRLALAHVGVLP
jgi:ADP-ribose pyrophosphatase YjhB (NUDIX family)